jgi:predicted peptidase
MTIDSSWACLWAALEHGRQSTNSPACTRRQFRWQVIFLSSSNEFCQLTRVTGGYGVKAANFRPTKVWTFHSSNDGTVSYRTTNSTVNTLRNDGQSKSTRCRCRVDTDLVIAVLFDDPKQGHVIDEYVLRNYPVIQW